MRDQIKKHVLSGTLMAVLIKSGTYGSMNALSFSGLLISTCATKGAGNPIVKNLKADMSLKIPRVQ